MRKGAEGRAGSGKQPERKGRVEERVRRVSGGGDGGEVEEGKVG